MSGGLDERGLPIGYPFKNEYELTPRDVRERMLTDPASVLLIDCRTGAEWDFVHIEGSVHIPLDEIERRADEAVPEHAGQTVAVICHHGVRSMRAALALRALGVPRAMSVAGGIELWSLSADRAVRRYDRSGGVVRAV
ncbi:MAG: rhodanese-like domain-containing protein [Planctomycetes bacterium]|nr:rhodanese-like domain-containing protein [Planctomycetota bacterium]